MNAVRLDQILRQVLVVPVLALLLGAGALLWEMHDANRTVALIENTDLTVAQMALVEKLVVDQESGLRGFQTTGDQRFLQPFHEAGNQLPAEFGRLRFMLQRQEQQPARNLENFYGTWQQGFALPLIATVQAGGQTTDVDLNLLGKQQMDAIRGEIGVLSAMIQQQRNIFVQRWHHQVRVMSLALVLLAIVLGLTIGLYTRRLLHDVSDAFRTSHNVLRLRAEEIFRSEQKLRTTLRSIGDGVITCDADGRVQTMNDVAQELTGWNEEDAHSRPLEDVFRILDESTRGVLEDPVAKVKRLDRVVGLSNHTVLLRRDGSEIFIDDSGAPIRDQQNKLIGVVLVFRDVTVAKQSQEALLANEKLAVAGRLAATIAHEIHNPLDSVSNLLYLMDGRSTPEESEHFLKLAKQELARVTQISRAMLSLHRESKAPVLIDLKEMLESILLLMERRFSDLGVRITADLGKDLQVHGFPAELRQVFTNLLINAAEASEPNGTVRLEGARQPAAAAVTAPGLRSEGGVLVTIADRGPGIPEDVRGSLFKPFFTTKGEHGTGLGLWVSRGIILKHGGRIDFASSTAAQDHGTTLSIFLATNPTINAGG